MRRFRSVVEELASITAENENDLQILAELSKNKTIIISKKNDISIKHVMKRGVLRITETNRSLERYRSYDTS